jgi:uncharacterized membrane protein
MSTAVLTSRIELSSVADTVLKAATRFWFGVTVVGQLAFAFAVASFYGMAAIRGDHGAWDKHFTHGYIPGDTMGNLAIAMHLVTAVVIMLSGAVQLVSQIRSRFPAFHRWNGRIYMLAGVGVSTAGLYMTWIRGSVGDVSQHLGSTLNAVLIWIFAAMALRYALARDFRSHRRWALRTFLVISASWFIRIMLFLTFLVFKGPILFDPATFTGPLLTFMSFAQYLVPLAVVELYFRAQDRPGAIRRMAMACLLFVLTLAMGVGLFAVTMAIWVPQVKAALDPRKPIVEILSATIASNGIDAGVRQYHDLKSATPRTYNFDEDQLNDLGYRLIRAKKYEDAIRIFQLNVDVFPKSSNAYDSLGEAYMDNGEKQLAITNYKRSVDLNPKNRNGEAMLKKLNAQ